MSSLHSLIPCNSTIHSFSTSRGFPESSRPCVSSNCLCTQVSNAALHAEESGMIEPYSIFKGPHLHGADRITMRDFDVLTTLRRKQSRNSYGLARQDMPTWNIASLVVSSAVHTGVLFPRASNASFFMSAASSNPNPQDSCTLSPKTKLRLGSAISGGRTTWRLHMLEHAVARMVQSEHRLHSGHPPASEEQSRHRFRHSQHSS